jgi:hypothetical protein
VTRRLFPWLLTTIALLAVIAAYPAAAWLMAR